MRFFRDEVPDEVWEEILRHRSPPVQRVYGTKQTKEHIFWSRLAKAHVTITLHLLPKCLRRYCQRKSSETTRY